MSTNKDKHLQIFRYVQNVRLQNVQGKTIIPQISFVFPRVGTQGQIRFPKQECIRVGCVPSTAVAVSPAEGRRGCLPLVWGVSGRHPPVNRITDRYKNITLQWRM